MTTVAYALGTPRAAAQRGGDCRARDLDQARNVHGTHRFAATTHARISNGLLRLTVGATGAAPSLTVQGRRGHVTVDDFASDIASDIAPGSISTPEWLDMGTVTIDSPAVAALLTAVRIVRLTPEAVTIRLVSPLMADAYVTLNRGVRSFTVQHGSTRAPRVTTTRRIRWTDTASPTGTATINRVEELMPDNHGFARFVAGMNTVTENAGAFSVTSASVRDFDFAAGIGIDAERDRVEDQHQQAADASRPALVVA